MQVDNDADMEARLAEQPVTEQEVRLILARLGERESCLIPASTVGDVAEAVAYPINDIGRLLGEIRKEAWEEQFGLRLDEYEERIRQIEGRIKPQAAAPPLQAVWFSPISEKERQQLHELVEKDRNKNYLPLILLSFFVLIVVGTFVIMATVLGIPSIK